MKLLYIFAAKKRDPWVEDAKTVVYN